jgi:uncharacterized membrane protein
MERFTKLLGGIAYIVLIVFCIVSPGGYRFPASLIALAAGICVVIAFVQAGNQLGCANITLSFTIGLVLYALAAFLFSSAVLLGMAAFMLRIGELLAYAVAGGIIGWAIGIVGGWFWYKASRSIGAGSGEKKFKRGGFLIFLGAILLIVGIGAIVALIGGVVQCIGFFTARQTDQRRVDDHSRESANQNPKTWPFLD